MNHALTIGHLLCSIVLLLGFASILFGLDCIFATAPSDAPQEQQGAGCAFLVFGVVLLIATAATRLLI